MSLFWLVRRIYPKYIFLLKKMTDSKPHNHCNPDIWCFIICFDSTLISLACGLKKLVAWLNWEIFRWHIIYIVLLESLSKTTRQLHVLQRKHCLAVFTLTKIKEHNSQTLTHLSGPVDRVTDDIVFYQG